MLSQLNSRKILQKSQVQKPSEQADIINSFYEQRRNRSFSAKQHTLLRKNISHFQQQSEQQNSFTASNQIQNYAKTAAISMLRRPPLALKSSNIQQHSFNQQVKKSTIQHSINKLPMSQYQPQPLSRYSTSNPSKSQLTDSQYREQLKKQLNKRVNINSYLSELNLTEKIETVHLKQKYLQTNIQETNRQKTQQNKSVKKINSIGDRTQAKMSDSNQQQKSEGRNQRSSSYESLSNKRKITNQSKNSRKSQSQQTKQINKQQLSNDEFTDRTQAIRHTFGSEKSSKNRKSKISSASANRSADESSDKSEKQQFRNRLNISQLSELQQNSHPLRQQKREKTAHPQPQPLQLKRNYFDPQLQAHYKRRIEDLQNELEQLRAKRKRQQKFIESIAKMRRVVECRGQQDGQYSLKQLWRWIKQLPSKNY